MNGEILGHREVAWTGSLAGPEDELAEELAIEIGTEALRRDPHVKDITNTRGKGAQPIV